MNQKKAKALRKALRAAGIDPTHVETDKRYHRKLMLGTFVHRALHKHCGRAIYQHAKSIGITRAAA